MGRHYGIPMTKYVQEGVGDKDRGGDWEKADIRKGAEKTEEIGKL